MKTYWGSGDTAPHILDLDARWRWVVSFTTRQLYLQGKSPCYPLDRGLAGPQSQSKRGGEEKNSQLLQGLEPPIFQPIAQSYTAELYRLLPHANQLTREGERERDRDVGAFKLQNWIEEDVFL
jgi:hypothetical protein